MAVKEKSLQLKGMLFHFQASNLESLHLMPNHQTDFGHLFQWNLSKRLKSNIY